MMIDTSVNELFEKAFELCAFTFTAIWNIFSLILTDTLPMHLQYECGIFHSFRLLFVWLKYSRKKF